MTFYRISLIFWLALPRTLSGEPYFFHFKALRQLANGIKEKRRDFFEEIYSPLLNHNQHGFTTKAQKDMLRFADEFCLDKLKEQLINKFINIR